MADAMSTFYEKDVEIFIIVSSDSDYIPLTQKLRESKKQVIGTEENKANKFYINVFSAFHYLDKKEEKAIKSSMSFLSLSINWLRRKITQNMPKFL